MRHLLALLLLAPLAVAADPEPKRHPATFAVVYNQGYAGDNLPADKDEFEKLVAAVKDAHFNVILGQYSADRAAVCKKHGVQLFVDLLVPDHHVYKSPDAARKLCESLKGDDTIYGYHLWSDNITEGTVAGRTRDVKSVHEWDDTHPAYVGTTNMNKVGRVEGCDLFGYYDFHWKRGGHWDHLNKALSVAQEKKEGFLRYDDPAPGIVGKGNPNRVGYTFATSVPFGLKGIVYHFSADVVDRKTYKLTALGEDLKKVNARLAAVGDEVMKLGVPTAVYSTAVTKTAKNDPVKEEVPAGLKPLPDDLWVHLHSGEVVVGLFADEKKRDVLAFANHNPYESQTVRMAMNAKTVERYDHTAGKWVKLDEDGKGYSFTVEEYGAELVRVTR